MYNEREREREREGGRDRGREEREGERGRRTIFHSRAECSTSLCVAIELCYDDRSYVDFIFESPGLRLTSLANSGIHHKHNVVRILVCVGGGGGREGGGEREGGRERERERERGRGSEGWRERYKYRNREMYSQNIIIWDNHNIFML